GVGRRDAGQRSGHARAGDDDPEPAHARRVAVLAHLLGVPVGAHDAHLVADAVVLERLAGRLHLWLVVLRAHDDPDQGRVDLDILERGRDVRHRIGGRRLFLYSHVISGLSFHYLPFNVSYY